MVRGFKQRKLNNLTTTLESTSCIVIYTKGAIMKAKAENKEHITFSQNSFQILSFADTFFLNSTSDESDGTLNIVEMTAMIITITIPGAIFYDPFSDMLLHLNTQNFD